MRTRWTTLLPRLAAAGLAAGLTAQAETVLPLANPGFEEAFAGWTDTTRPPMCETLEAAAHSGRLGLRITDRDKANGSNLRSSAAPARAGGAYALRLWARTLDGSNMGIYLRFFDAQDRALNTDAAGNHVILGLPAVREWVQYTLVGRAPESTATVSVWLHSINAAVVQADLDDVTVSELTEEEAKTVQTTRVRAPGDEFPIATAQRIDELAALLPEAPRGLGDPITTRGRWDELAKLPSAKGCIARAEPYLTTPPPEVPDELYLEFSRTGNRSNYERPYGQRPGRINALVLAECLENQGRFLPAIERDILALCDERSWVMPAHDSSLSNFKGTQLYIDLGSSARAWLLATADWLLGDRLAPTVRERLRAECRRRVLDVYLQAVHAGELRGNWWMRTTNNWNAVCTAGVVGTALTLLADRHERAEFLAGMELSNPFFISGFTEDGYCSEGMGYWDYGFGHYMMLGDLVLKATDGKLDLFAGSPKLLRIAAFPQNLLIQPGVAPAFADCGVNPRPSGQALALIHRRLPEAMPVAVRCDPLGGVIHTGLFAFDEDTFAIATAEAGTPPVLPLRTWFDQAGILVSRSAPAAKLAFGAAFKGGHNAEHHNHNDVGSYVIALDGKAYLLDPGGEVYTRRTFSKDRYVSKVLNSYGHAVPVVAGKLQSPGAQARGEVLATEFTDAVDRLVLSLKSCYDVPELQRLERTFENRRAEGVMVIEDRVQFATPQSFATALITLERAQRRDANTLVVYDAKRALAVTVEAEGGAWEYALEEIENAGRAAPRRLGITFTEPVREARVRLTVRPAELTGDLPGVYLDPPVGPGFEPIPERAITVEAEAFSEQTGGTVTVVDKPAASGGKGFKLWDKQGHRLGWTFDVAAAGRYAVQVRACHMATVEVTRQVLVDDQAVGEAGAACVFPFTGGWSTDADNWRDLYLVLQGKPLLLDLRAGRHTLALLADHDGGLNLDWLRLVPVK
jgi:hypothetical protein